MGGATILRRGNLILTEEVLHTRSNSQSNFFLPFDPFVDGFSKEASYSSCDNSPEGEAFFAYQFEAEHDGCCWKKLKPKNLSWTPASQLAKQVRLSVVNTREFIFHPLSRKGDSFLLLQNYLTIAG